LKRVAADHKGDIAAFLPKPVTSKNGKRVALIGGGPASLTVARDLAPLGYQCVVLDQDPKAGGMMRTRIPHFRVPEHVIEEETGYILYLGVEFRGGQRVSSLKALLGEGWDAVFIGTGAPHGQDLALPGRNEACRNIHIGVEWLANIWFQHIKTIGRKVVVIGGGNTAIDCGRSARRLGGDDVKLVARSRIEDMKAAVWEKEDLKREGVVICNDLVPKEFTYENGRLTGVLFEPVKSVFENGRRSLVPSGAPLQHLPCDDVLIAVGQEPAFSWIERDLGIAFGAWDMPTVDPKTLKSSHPKVFFGGDAAFGPKNIITAVAHGHEAAISIDLLLTGADQAGRPAPTTAYTTQRTPLPPRHIPEVSVDARHPMPLEQVESSLADIRMEVELGFDIEDAIAEAGRCLHCELETVFSPPLCVECKACEAVCPTDCITFTRDGDETDLRTRLSSPANNLAQELYVASNLVSHKVKVKNEDVCLHCGLCAENCPTGAWQMQTFLLTTARAGQAPAVAISQGTIDG
jgi:formate dehydrogenase beta subunit